MDFQTGVLRHGTFCHGVGRSLTRPDASAVIRYILEVTPESGGRHVFPLLCITRHGPCRVRLCFVCRHVSRRGGGPATTAARENSTLIVRAELDAFQGRSAWDAVYTLRRRWTQPGLGATFGGAPIYARVVVDGTHRGELRELRRISANDIESMRFLSAPDPDTTIKYGLGNEGGVIEVTTIRGRPSPKLSGDVIPAAAQGRLP